MTKGNGLARRAEIGAARKLKTRERLIRGALSVVAAHGVDLPVIEDFIKAAKVSHGTFYNYFRTREELIHSLYEYVGQERRRQHDQIRAQISDQAHRLVAGVRLNLRRARSDTDWGRVYELERMRKMLDGGAEHSAAKRDICSAMSARRIRKQDPDFAIEIFYGILFQGIRRAYSGRGPENLDELVAATILAALGMPYREAERISKLPLPVGISGSNANSDSEGAQSNSIARRVRRPRRRRVSASQSPLIPSQTA